MLPYMALMMWKNTTVEEMPAGEAMVEAFWMRSKLQEAGGNVSKDGSSKPSLLPKTRSLLKESKPQCADNVWSRSVKGMQGGQSFGRLQKERSWLEGKWEELRKDCSSNRSMQMPSRNGNFSQGGQDGDEEELTVPHTAAAALVGVLILRKAAAAITHGKNVKVRKD